MKYDTKIYVPDFIYHLYNLKQTVAMSTAFDIFQKGKNYLQFLYLKKCFMLIVLL